ncbi:MAG: substrate-binding domain-containing protein, partial [Cyanobacteriota bacterium]
VKVITANPKTSGVARWNFLGLWGSVSQNGGSEAQAKAYVSSVYRNVENLPKDAREATDAFLKRGQGDVLLNYENEAILARSQGELKGPIVVPPLNAQHQLRRLAPSAACCCSAASCAKVLPTNNSILQEPRALRVAG